jgi:hypothetical protein
VFCETVFEQFVCDTSVVQFVDVELSFIVEFCDTILELFVCGSSTLKFVDVVLAFTVVFCETVFELFARSATVVRLVIIFPALDEDLAGVTFVVIALPDKLKIVDDALVVTFVDITFVLFVSCDINVSECVDFGGWGGVVVSSAIVINSLDDDAQ